MSKIVCFMIAVVVVWAAVSLLGRGGLSYDRQNTMDYLLIVEPVVHEVLGDIELRDGRPVFVSCNGDVHAMDRSTKIQKTLELC